MACVRVVVPPYEVAARLTQIAGEHWETIDGEASLGGSPSLLTLPPARFYNAIFVWSLRHVKDPERFVMQLNAPPRGKPRRVTPEVVQQERHQFAAFAAAVGAHKQEAKSQGG